MSSTSANFSATPQQNLAKGLFFLIAGMLIFNAQDVFAKMLVAQYSPFQIVMIRFWGFLAMAIYFASREGPVMQSYKSAFPRIQILRGLLLVVHIMLVAEAFKTIALGDVAAINMIYPLLVTIFAIPVLGEKVGPFRAAIVFIGFLGALIIIRPGFVTVELGTILVLIAACFYSLYLVLTRKVARKDSTTVSLMYVATMGFLISSAIGVFFWKNMTFLDSILVIVLCFTTCFGHAAVMLSMRYAPASFLQPFNYLSLPVSITMGFLVFGTMVDGFAIVGSVIIVGAGLIVMWRERVISASG